MAVVVTDPIADMLTRIRNANKMRYKTLEVPASKMKIEIAKILKDEGFIKNYEIVEEKPQNKIVITLKYGQNNERVITGLKRISKPGLRVYAKVDEIPRVLNGLGIAILSTPNGVITDKKARSEKIGGEVLAYIW
jgi:small subunit ribosomal protein S8